MKVKIFEFKKDVSIFTKEGKIMPLNREMLNLDKFQEGELHNWISGKEIIYADKRVFVGFSEKMEPRYVLMPISKEIESLMAIVEVNGRMAPYPHWRVELIEKRVFE